LIEQPGDQPAVGQRAIYAPVVMVAGLVAVVVGDELVIAAHRQHPPLP
jgi:hypothetical protein